MEQTLNHVGSFKAYIYFPVHVAVDIIMFTQL